MKRRLSSNSRISYDEYEPPPKRPRISHSSTVMQSDNNNQIDNDEDEIVVDEPIRILNVIINQNSVTHLNSCDDNNNDDDDIIEIVQSHIQVDNPIDTDDTIISIVDEDSDNDNDDQEIDVTDIIPTSVSYTINNAIYSSDVEIVEEEIEEEFSSTNLSDEEFIHSDNNSEPIEIIINDNDLIDLTNDEPRSISTSPVSYEHQLSTDIQQCPICFETLSHLQRIGIHLMITPCRHVMCTICTRQLLAISPRCPLCRENLNSTTLIPYCILA